MINKQNIWFTFLFSVILVLSIFYLNMGNDDISDLVLEKDTNDSTLVVNESTELVALRIKDDEETLETINELQNILLNEEMDFQAKNDAYQELINISTNKSKEEKIEKIILEEFDYEALVKIEGNTVNVIILSSTHDYSLANKIIRRINEEFNIEMYITIKFD